MKAILLLGFVLTVGPAFTQSTDIRYSYADPRDSHTSFDTFLGWAGSSFGGTTWNSAELGGQNSVNVVGSGFDLGAGVSYVDQSGLVLAADLMVDFGALGGAKGSSQYLYQYYSVTGLKESIDAAVGYHWRHNDSGDLRLTVGYFLSLATFSNSTRSTNGSSWVTVTDAYGWPETGDLNLSQGISLEVRYDFQVDDTNAFGLRLRDSLALAASNSYSDYPASFNFYQDLKINSLEVDLVWSSLNYPNRNY